MADANSEPELIFTEYSVRLTSTEIIARLLTPDFLRYNEIVSPSLRLVPPIILGQESTNIEFTNGLAVRAADTEVAFAHVPHEPSVPDAAECVAVASRFIENLSELEYVSVTADVQGYMMIPHGCPGIVNIGPRLEGVLPVIYHHAVYPLPGREVNFYAYEVSRESDRHIDCLDLRSVTSYSAEPNRDLEQDILFAILATWEDQLNEFFELSTSFYRKHIQ